MNLNRIQLIGRIGSDPNVTHLEGGNVVAKYSVATSEKYKSKNGEMVEQTQWHTVVSWGKQAEYIEKYFSKGMLVFVEGKIRYRTFKDKNGVERYTTEIQPDNVSILEGKTKKHDNKVDAEEIETDDVPY